MESLLDAAQELCMKSGTTHRLILRPDFVIPLEYQNIPTLDYLELRDCDNNNGDNNNNGNNAGVKGKGYFAKCDLQRGTLLMVAKPIAMIMDWQGDEDEEQDKHNNDGCHDDDDDHDMHDEDDDHDDDDQEPRHNELLLLQILEKLQQTGGLELWNEYLTKLFPRTVQDLTTLPAWVCHTDAVFVQIETAIQALSASQQFTKEQVKDISKRLPLIVRYNVLSIETCPELLSHSAPLTNNDNDDGRGTGGFSSLSGVGLYYLPSFFNHSSHSCNCSRYAIGDIMFFVINQDVTMGQEVTISYLEHDVLCENASRRNHMLSMNFNDANPHELLQQQQQQQEGEKKKLAAHVGKNNSSSNGRNSNDNHDDDDDHDDHDGPDLPVVDSDVQNELMSMDPFERLDAIEELMAQAMGLKQPSGTASATSNSGQDDDNNHHRHHHDTTLITDNDNNNHEASASPSPAWFQCDVQNLRIIKAITLDSMGQTLQALALWEEAVQFTETKLPPLDESSIVMRVQAALCAWQAQSTIALASGEIDNETATVEQMQHRARHHANVALTTHKLLFGGGVQRFKRRMNPDFRLTIRSVSALAVTADCDPCPVDILWPLIPEDET